MAGAITWTIVSEPHVVRLAQCHAVEDCKRELAQIFNIDESDPTHAFLLDLHFYNYSFARQQHFVPTQISVLMGIFQQLIAQDFSPDSTSTLASSYQHFQSLLLTHSVDRSPKSVQIFSPADVSAIVDVVAHSYYRHFYLHKCIFTPFYHTHLVQKNVDNVQLPPRPRPLHEAFLHPSEEPQVSDEPMHPPEGSGVDSTSV